MPGAAIPGPINQLVNPAAVKDGTSPLHIGSQAQPTGTGPGGKPNTAKTAASGPSIQIDPPNGCEKASDQNPIFSITDQPAMPVVTINAKVVGVPGADPTATTDFSWIASVSYDSSKTPHGLHKKTGKARVIAPVTANGGSKGGLIVIDLSKTGQIRGGDFNITVTATVGGQLLKGETKGWRIQGTNPAQSAVANAMPDDTCRKIACVESGMQQFFRAPKDGNAWYPYFSRDLLLGVGICQLTDPAPTDDQIWDWTTNVTAGIGLYDKKKKISKSYPGQVAKTTAFLNLVKKYNETFKAQSAAIPKPGGASTPAPIASQPSSAAQPAAAKPFTPVTITVPEFTADQLEDDTIRGFNGYAGDDGFLGPRHLHEFRIKVDKATGNLVVDGDPATGKVTAQWERVPVPDRPGAGDPNYIDDIKNRDPNTCAKLK